MQRTPKPINVRFAPKATVSDRSAACRDGPKADMMATEKTPDCPGLSYFQIDVT
jgi:hypothetical protein